MYNQMRPEITGYMTKEVSNLCRSLRSSGDIEKFYTKFYANFVFKWTMYFPLPHQEANHAGTKVQRSFKLLYVTSLLIAGFSRTIDKGRRCCGVGGACDLTERFRVGNAPGRSWGRSMPFQFVPSVISISSGE